MESMENQETVHKDLQILLEIKENQFCFDCSKIKNNFSTKYFYFI